MGFWGRISLGPLRHAWSWADNDAGAEGRNSAISRIVSVARPGKAWQRVAPGAEQSRLRLGSVTQPWPIARRELAMIAG